MKKNLFLLLLSACIVSACNKGPQPITYGSDACDFCRMTIVDQAHAAQVVTVKGKNYKFDAIECLIYFLDERDESQFSHILCASLTQPGTMISSTEATFIISPKIPSPMGAFLSAVSDRNEALEIVKDSGGETYNWRTLKTELNKNL